ncbi:unnamed protein product [Sphenostylis stenocarpa]|uniref:Uncharacterized protein n=1 Tax=Sphenostylis stenocarpa TaxID=92480 RepID=A0AA86W1Q7_9FABA|nr:unnamed protein product [Sphenostylis stenocarpa]
MVESKLGSEWWYCHLSSGTCSACTVVGFHDSRDCLQALWISSLYHNPAGKGSNWDNARDSELCVCVQMCPWRWHGTHSKIAFLGTERAL